LKSYVLNIADYKIRFENPEGNIDLMPSGRYSGFLSATENHDVCIRVFPGDTELPAGTQKVFSAPYVEEINGLRLKKKDRFWSVHKKDDTLYILTEFPFSGDNRTGLLRFSLESRNWDLFLNSSSIRTGSSDQVFGADPMDYLPDRGCRAEPADGAVSPPQADPMDYPLDGLILYYLTVIHGDIMIHASGINSGGKGFMFSGVSGKGKSTMAGLWDRHGARVIHDDRLIIRKVRGSYSMFNTPVYRNDEARESPLDAIFIIEHGTENEALRLHGASAITSLLSNCIQHNWDEAVIRQSLDAAIRICASIPVFQLRFRPDNSIIAYLLQQVKTNESG
jgi:hypothetical protein